MTVLERIKNTARIKKNMSLTALEQELGYSNGSLAKAKDIPSSRILKISIFLGVSMEFLMTGKEMEHTIEDAGKDFSLSNMSEKMKDYAVKMASLSKESQELLMQMIDKLSD